MKVIVVFDFEDITYLEGGEADDIVNDITTDTLKWMKEYKANVWVDDVQPSDSRG